MLSKFNTFKTIKNCIEKGDLKNTFHLLSRHFTYHKSTHYNSYLALAGWFNSWQIEQLDGIGLDSSELGSIKGHLRVLVYQLESEIDTKSNEEIDLWNARRREDLSSRIQNSYQNLSRWEDKLQYAENPSEQMRCEIAIRQIKHQIQNYKSELATLALKSDSNNVSDLKKHAFLSFANEDKETVATPLANILNHSGIKIWYSGFELNLGDSIMNLVNSGLSKSQYGIVILSPHYIGKSWPLAELQALFALQTSKGRKVILPVWHQIEYEEVLERAPIMADKFAISTSQGLDLVALAIKKAIHEDNHPFNK